MILDKKEINESNLAKEFDDIKGRLKLDKIEDALYYPKFFQLETVRLCNAKCPYCAVDQWDKSSPYLSDELFDKFETEIKDYTDWINVVCVARAGEPLLDKKIGVRIKRLKNIGIKWVNLSTNGSLLNREKIEELLGAGIDEIMISIDSLNKEEYEKIKIGLNFDEVINNIKMLFKLRNELKPDLTIRIRAVSFLNFNKNEHKKKYDYWEDFWNKLKKSQDRIYMKKPHNWGNQKNMDDHDIEYGIVYHPCILPWSTLHITASGVVTLCPADYDGKFNLGDFNNETIKEIWNGEKINSIRGLHSQGKRNEIAFCEGCKIFDQDFSLEKK